MAIAGKYCLFDEQGKEVLLYIEHISGLMDHCMVVFAEISVVCQQVKGLNWYHHVFP